MKINDIRLNQIIKEEMQKINEADVFDLDLFRQQKETETDDQNMRNIEEVVDNVGDMLAGVATNLLDVIRDLKGAQRIEEFKTNNPGKLEALEMVWTVIADWEYGMYPKNPENIARRKELLVNMPDEDV